MDLSPFPIFQPLSCRSSRRTTHSSSIVLDMFSVSRYNISRSKYISQSASGNIDDIAFNLSALRASLGYKSFHKTPRSLSQHNASLPINQLPIELLCDIFSKFLEDDREHPDYTSASAPLVSFYTRADPTILGQVCSWWRRVALSTHALWANIFIAEPHKAQVSRVRMWLERAGSNPLNLAIKETRPKGKYDAGALYELLSSFTRQLALWRTIDFSLPVEALQWLTNITNNPSKCRNLESASLYFRTDGRHPSSTKSSIDAVWKALHSSPTLYRVNWWGLYRGEMPSHAPWSQLSNVHLRSKFTVESLLDVLSLCPHIQQVYISCLSLPSHHDSPKSDNHLVLQKLHTLVLEAQIGTGPLFQRLTLPALRSLSIQHQYLDNILSRDFVDFQACLVRSSCPLERFTFYDHTLPADFLHTYLTAPCLRNVNYLEVQGVISDKIIESFTRESVGGRHEIMPNLEEMKLWKCVTSDGLLGRMVVSRWSGNLNDRKACKKLKKAILRTDGGYGIKDKGTLSTLFDAGLQGWMC
ncbi:hypothetical protein BYT27DRAFT_7176631 [Phlegmacium glaucopus]|nr:hypothetical protein BYT27DRAFT_7176631 [Phlegmacium glaucopus]